MSDLENKVWMDIVNTEKAFLYFHLIVEVVRPQDICGVEFRVVRACQLAGGVAGQKGVWQC